MAQRKNPVDEYVGNRLRLRRTLNGMSQERLGEAVGLTFQQIQKYEKGANRVGASRLYQFSQILSVPPSFFFDGIADHLQAPEEAFIGTGLKEVPQAGYHANGEDGERDPLSSRETLEMMRAFNRISDPAVRKRIFELCKAVSDKEPEDEEARGRRGRKRMAARR
ncbi:MAG: helix-turn-helix domain-containing protein [Sneathiellaceae bacterium]